MGGTSKTETTEQSSQTQPWAPAQPLLGGILGQLRGQLGNAGPSGAETSALDALAARAGAGNPFAGRIGGVADMLLGGGTDRTPMVNDAYRQYQDQLGATARGDFLDPASNPALQRYLALAGDDAQKRVTDAYVGAGRDPTGAGSFGQNVGRGVAEAQSPILMNAYEAERRRQMDAAGQLYGAGGQTAGLLSGLDQAALANRQAGIGAAGAATAAELDPMNRMLAIEAQRRGIPLSVLAQITGMGAGIAGLGKSTTGTSTPESATPFNPLSLAPLALMPFTGGASGLMGAGMGAGGLGTLGSGLFSGLSNGFMGSGSFLPR